MERDPLTDRFRGRKDAGRAIQYHCSIWTLQPPLAVCRQGPWISPERERQRSRGPQRGREGGRRGVKNKMGAEDEYRR